MKNFNLIFFAGLIFFFAGCKKEEQQLVFENGYTINEGGTVAGDYRGEFEGLYFLTCTGSSNTNKSVRVKTLATRAGYLIMESLADRSAYQDSEQEIIAKIDTSGAFVIDPQKIATDDYGSYSENILYSGAGSIESDSLKVSYKLVKRMNGTPVNCECKGKRN